MLDTIVLILSVVVMLGIGFVVVLRNWRNLINQLFGLVLLSSVAWTVVLYATNHVQGINFQLFVNRLSLFVGYLVILVLWFVSVYFPFKLHARVIQKWIALSLTPIIFTVTMLGSGIVMGVEYRPERQITDIVTGDLYFLYIAGALLLLVFLTWNFISSYRSDKLSILQKQQILVVSAGLLIALVTALLLAAIIPSITGNWEISKYGSIGTWFYIAFLAYSIDKHKLLDIRLVIARSFAYLLSLSLVVGVTAVAILIMSTYLEDIGFSQNQVNLVQAFIVVILALSYQPIKKFFDRVTNRIFYRDAYDTQDLLDSLNDVLLSNIDINLLSSKSLEIVNNTIKSDFSYIVIESEEGHRSLGAGSKANAKEIEKLNDAIGKIKSKVIVTDELNESQSESKEALREQNVSIVVRLIDKHENTAKELGFIVLGAKKSGNPYSLDDRRILEIISDELVIAIQNALRFEEIQKFNITLQEKIDDATAELRVKNKKLKELDEAKDEFISMASHQLRTPLTSVKGYLSMVLEGDVGKVSKKQQELLSQAFVSSQRMVFLIADLLNVSRLKTGKFIIEKTPVNLKEMIDGEIGQLRQTIESKGLKLDFKAPDKFPTLMFDETKIRQVVMNFLDNAIYYTNEGIITIELVADDKKVEYMVHDTGIGVPRNEQHKIFDKFFRAKNAQKARPDGTGLGLFMAKKAIVAMGGSVVFTSKEGEGSTFGFSFPISEVKLEESKDKTKKKPASKTNKSKKS